MDWLYEYVDTLDIIVLTVIAVIGAYVYSNYRQDQARSRPQSVASNIAQPAKSDRSFLGRMKAENRQVLILFGSQTGTAEELAGRLSKDLHRYGKKPLVMDPEEIDVEDLPKITEIADALLVLCVATYGEGDPTDNSQALYEFVNNTDADFSGLSFAVFGLGNKTYTHFNEVGKVFDKRLGELGARRVYELGLGDDDANLEEDFMRWREAFLPSLSETFGWELSQQDGLERQYRLEVLIEPPANVFTGEFGRIGAYEKPRPPFDQKNPYRADIAVNRELHLSSSDRSCRHVEFTIDNTRVRYEVGDHLGICPTNEPALVEKIGALLGVDLDTVFRLINLDTDSTKRHPFPCPCSYRTALSHYVEIVLPVKSHVLRAFAEYTTDEKEKARLMLLSSASEEGLHEYGQHILKERRSVVDILEQFVTCRPPIEVLLEVLPRLQARYYSISSSPKTNNEIVSVTAVVLKYAVKEREVRGVCTTYLADKYEGNSVPIFVRKSTMRLPHRHTTPVVMVGPGTGFAPFRGFIQERSWQKTQGKELGEMLLFFGCRRPDSDHIYKSEMDEYVREGVLTRCCTAYSRVADEKEYVQHQMWVEREHIWSIVQRGGNIYVCGKKQLLIICANNAHDGLRYFSDARNMARDVLATIMRIFREVGQMDEPAAQKLLKDLERQRRYQSDVWS